MMGGYNWENCDFVQPVNGNVPVQNCIRIEHFSEYPSATKFDDNSPIGSATRNIAAYFKNTTMLEIATYQTGNPSAPATAPTLSVTNLSCYGQNKLEWSFVNLADSYEVYRSENSGFTYPVRVATTMDFDTLLYANYPQNAYYRVKACNDAGCSGYSNQVFGYYLAGCM